MKKKLIIIFVITLLLDQIIKFFISQIMPNFILIANFLSFIYTENTGVAFSMLSGNRILIILISIILLTFLIYLLRKDYLLKNENNILKDISFGLLFGGITGNLIDRIIRGVVIDFISLNIFGYSFPIFNLADIAITIGVILMIFYSFREEKQK